MEFPADAVRRHTETVTEASEEVVQARAAASEVALGSGAYGQLCAFLPALFTPLFGLAVEVMSDAAAALDETASSLRAVVSDMTAADVDSAQRLNTAGEPLP